MYTSKFTSLQAAANPLVRVTSWHIQGTKLTSRAFSLAHVLSIGPEADHVRGAGWVNVHVSIWLLVRMFSFDYIYSTISISTCPSLRCLSYCLPSTSSRTVLRSTCCCKAFESGISRRLFLPWRPLGAAREFFFLPKAHYCFSSVVPRY